MASSADRMAKHRAARASAGLPKTDILRAWVGDAFGRLAEAGAIDADLQHLLATEVGRMSEIKGVGEADAVICHLIDRWKYGSAKLFGPFCTINCLQN